MTQFHYWDLLGTPHITHWGLHQNYVLREIPPPLKLGLFQFDFLNGAIGEEQASHLKERIQHVMDVWYYCVPRKITWVTDLVGEMKTHYASMELILLLKEPGCIVVVPNIPMKSNWLANPNGVSFQGVGRGAHKSRLFNPRKQTIQLRVLITPLGRHLGIGTSFMLPILLFSLIVYGFPLCHSLNV